MPCFKDGIPNLKAWHFLLDDPYHIAGDGVQRGRTAQAHRVGQLIACLLYTSPSPRD